MTLHETEALVLRVRPYGELDLLLTFYSKDKGKITGLAKAAQHSRKRFGGRIDLCSHVNLYYQEKNVSQLVFLAQTELLSHFLNMKKDLLRSAYASFICELILNLVAERDADAPMFEKIVELFHSVDQKAEFIGDIFDFHRWFLKRIGLSLMVSTCASCKQTMKPQDEYDFSFIQGGVMCLRCKAKFNSDTALAHACYEYLKGDCKTPLDANLQSHLEVFFHKYFSFHYGKAFRSFNYLQEMKQFAQSNVRHQEDDWRRSGV